MEKLYFVRKSKEIIRNIISNNTTEVIFSVVKINKKREKKLKLLIMFTLFLLNIDLTSQCNSALLPFNDNCTNASHASFEMMNIPCAWQEANNGSSDIVIGVPDTYFQLDHLDLIGKIDTVFYPNSCNIFVNLNHHGTSSLGAISAIKNNNFCVAGAGGNVRVAACCQPANDLNLIEMMNAGINIIYIASWSGVSTTTAQALVDNGVVLILADLGDCWSHLDNIKGVIKVGITKLNGNYINYDPGCPSIQSNIDIFSVAEDNCRLSLGSSCQEASESTSLSAGYVAGVVGLMRSVNKCLSPQNIQDILEKTAGPIPPNAGGGIGLHGIMNAYEAVKMAKNFTETWIADEQAINDDLQLVGSLEIVNNTSSGYKTITINSDITVGSNKSIVINSGVKFILNGALRFGEKSRLIVKRNAQLIIEGGLCTTNNCESSQWQGIIVEGNSTLNQPNTHHNGNNPDVAGIVIVNDNSIIENARDGISTNPSHLPWPNNQYYGGLIYATNATFRNNKRAVAFMKYGRTDNSRFDNVIFTGEYGTTHWANEGVTYENNCTFNIDRQAIYTIDASINVLDSEFEMPTTGPLDNQIFSISLDYTAPNSALNKTSIAGNDFFDGFYGIKKKGGYINTFKGDSISNNNFVGQNKGINLEGYGNSTISNNEFMGCEFGSNIEATGTGVNIQEHNIFSTYTIGIGAYYNCEDYSFVNNCFDRTGSTTRPFVLQGEAFGASNPILGRIQDPLGSDVNTSGGNCLPLRAGPSRQVNGLSFTFIGKCDSFTYLYLDTLECRSVPSKYKYKQQVANQRNISCEGGGNAINLGAYTCIDRYTSLANLETEITRLKNEIALFTNLLNYTPPNTPLWYQYKLRLIYMKRCLTRLLTIRTNIMSDSKSYASLKVLMQNESFEIKAGVIGAMIRNEDYNEAYNYLQEIRGESQEAGDFSFAQLKLIESLTTQDYQLSPNDKSILYDACKRKQPLNVYCRTVYFKLTGDIVETDKENIEEASPREFFDDQEALSIRIFPNPTNGKVTIESSQKENKLEIYNHVGKSIIEKNIREHSIIDISDNEVGIYFFIVKDKEGKIIHSQKIIKQ